MIQSWGSEIGLPGFRFLYFNTLTELWQVTERLYVCVSSSAKQDDNSNVCLLQLFENSLKELIKVLRKH